jgi:hypothetical protein
MRTRPATRTVVLAALSVALLTMPVLFVLAFPDQASGTRDQLGVDYRLYMAAARRWLAGGPYFEPYQLAGPYDIHAGDILYPPVALLFFAPFTILPAALYWAIPLAVLAAVVWHWRPRPEVWPLLAFCAAWPTTVLKTWTGNPVLWIAAALAVATLFRGAAVLVLLKPSLAPFALFGANRRSWWLALGLLVVVSLPFGSLWTDWLTTLANSRGGGLLYSALEIPFLALPLVAWAGRRRPAERVAAPSSS